MNRLISENSEKILITSNRASGDALKCLILADQQKPPTKKFTIIKDEEKEKLEPAGHFESIS